MLSRGERLNGTSRMELSSKTWPETVAEGIASFARARSARMALSPNGHDVKHWTCR